MLDVLEYEADPGMICTENLIAARFSTGWSVPRNRGHNSDRAQQPVKPGCPHVPPIAPPICATIALHQALTTDCPIGFPWQQWR